MQDRHIDRQRYFNEQAYTTEKYVIPFTKPHLEIGPSHRIMEVGCGEGGNLKPFVDMGCECVGVDINKEQIERAKMFFANHEHSSKVKFLGEDIYRVHAGELGTFDYIFLRDVIEHIVDQDRFMGYIQTFLKPDGLLFIGFPPWYMPFGGHQQICRNKWLSKLPYIHLLPKSLYKSLLTSFGESQAVIDELMYIVDTGISIERLKRIISKHRFDIKKEQVWLINPNYEVKFGLQPRKQFSLLSSIPFVRNLFSTCGYYLLGKKYE